jgi:hypothetical protein
MHASTEQSIIDELLDLVKKVVHDIAIGGEVSLATYSELLATLKAYSNEEVSDGSHD